MMMLRKIITGLFCMTFTLSSVFIGMSFNAKAAKNAGAIETVEFDILYDTGFKTEFGTTVNGSPGSAVQQFRFRQSFQSARPKSGSLCGPS